MKLHRECRNAVGSVGHLWQWGFAAFLCLVLRTGSISGCEFEEILATLLSATHGLGQVKAFAGNLKAVREWEGHKQKKRILLEVVLPSELSSV